MPHSRPINNLRRRNLAEAKRDVLEALKARPRLPYEDAWDLALAFPLVWESDVKAWIEAWREAGVLKIEGLTRRQRVPKLKANNTLVWVQPTRNERRR